MSFSSSSGSSYKCEGISLRKINPITREIRTILKEEGFRRLFFRHPGSERYSKDGIKARIEISSPWQCDSQNTTYEDKHYRRTVNLKINGKGELSETFEKKHEDWYSQNRNKPYS